MGAVLSRHQGGWRWEKRLSVHRSHAASNASQAVRWDRKSMIVR